MRRSVAISLLMGTLIGLVGVRPVAAATSHERVPLPTVRGPIAGQPFGAAPVPLPGYTEQEFFVSGTATGYQQVGTWGADGRWSVAPAEQAPYTTRVLVRRPTPDRFNGTVIVEWLNVSAGVDLDPDFLYGSAELLRAGYAWVGVSAQAVGVNALRAINPARYGALSHPGDTFSYSIYSQATRAAIDGGVLGGLRPRTVIAAGESQSAFRMVTYANAIQPIDGLFDGFLIHSRSASSAPISQAPQATQPSPPIVDDRTDLREPVLTVETETDLSAPNLAYAKLTQPDSRDVRLWEIAGTSHVDAAELTLFGQEIAMGLHGPPPPVATCGQAPNSDQENAVMDAAFAQLDRWVRFGVPPRHANRIAMADGSITRDADGNAEGGIRTPEQQVPTGVHNGNGNTGPAFPCALYGTTTPFSAAELTSRYPTHKDYVARVAEAAVADTLAGFLLPADAHQIVSTAAGAPIP